VAGSKKPIAKLDYFCYDNYMIRQRDQEIKRRRKRLKEAKRKKGLLKKVVSGKPAA
jgi:hypothetical protein